MLVSGVAEAVPRVLAHAVQRKYLRARDARLVATEHHAALAGHHVLGHVEAVAAEIAETARARAVVLGFDRVRAILDDDEVVAARDRHDRIHCACAPREMHRQDRTRAFADRRLDRGGVDRVRQRIDVGEHRGQARMDDRVDARAERQRRGDHFAARLEPGRDHRDMQRRGTRIDRRDMAGRNALVRREIGLEPRDARPGAEPARTQAILDRGDFLLADRGGTEDEEGFGHGGVGTRRENGECATTSRARRARITGPDSGIAASRGPVPAS